MSTRTPTTSAPLTKMPASLMRGAGGADRRPGGDDVWVSLIVGGVPRVLIVGETVIRGLIAAVPEVVRPALGEPVLKTTAAEVRNAAARIDAATLCFAR